MDSMSRPAIAPSKLSPSKLSSVWGVIVHASNPAITASASAPKTVHRQIRKCTERNDTESPEIVAGIVIFPLVSARSPHRINS